MKPTRILIFLFFLFWVFLYLGYYWFTIKIEQGVPGSAVTPNARMLLGTSTVSITEELVAYTDTAIGFYARPTASGTYPGVVLIHDWWGLNDNIKGMARLLAKEGYNVIAVDLYGGKIASTSTEAMVLHNAVSTEDALRNLRAATTFLRNRGITRLASLGWCYGGGKSLELALSGEKLDATVIFDGTLATSTNTLANITWPVLGMFGAEDRVVPVETVRMFERALNTLGIPNEIYIYPRVGYACANPSGAYDAPEETRDAWEKTLIFLRKHLYRTAP